VIELFRKGPFRLAIAFTLAVSLTTVAGVGLIYWNVSTSFETRRKVLVVDETAALLNDNQSKLQEDLAAWLSNGLLLYSVAGLFDQSGRPIAGNLNAIPPGLVLDGRVHDLSLPKKLIKIHDATDIPDEVLVSGMQRSDGTVLVLGRTLNEVSALRREILDFGLTAVALLLLLSVGIGFRASVTQARRLKLIQQTLNHVMEGALHERLPIMRGRDDLDRLAQDVNRMLEMLETLLHEVKGVGDNIAHDLRTPLSVMRAKLERALASTADGDGEFTGRP
jgi:methyl-accepting chemotaxis protein